MARHAASSHRRHTLLRAGLTVVAAGAALGAGSAAAQAADGSVGTESVAGPGPVLGAAPLETVTGTVARSVDGVGHLKSMQLHPLANTGVDPLDNSVGTQVADFEPVSTAIVTDHITKGQALEDLPVAGPVTGALLP
ncbi:hypothetical protein [Streptomyces sp. NPDC018833]|uniref:hypothetical protein n=1 Tax=Streptomyces sp. NPDC018833 TaxID=3365053 RepID=UPI0037BDFDF0